MKRILSLIILGIVSVSLVSCGNDSSGEKDSEERIAATSISTCEVLKELDLTVVGVPSSTLYDVTDYYEDAEVIGSPMSPDMETLKALNPTDVIGPLSLKDSLQSQYEEIGVNSTYINLESVQGMYKSIEDLGEKYNKQDRAAELVEDFKTFINEFQGEIAGKSKPKVLILMGLPGSYVAATDNSYVGSLVKLAGGENVYFDDVKNFLTINTEELIKKEPDIIFRTAHVMPGEVREMFNKEFSKNDIWQHFRAVKEGRVYDLDPDTCGMSANFRYKEALEDIASKLYNEDR